MKLGNTLILGDSYSTFKGYNPDGYDYWFSTEEVERTDVNKVEQTWWYQVFDGNDNVLIRNESFSGTTICNTVRPQLSVDTSFISRLDKLIDDGFFNENKIDTILIFGGTNDCWINVPFGENQFNDFSKDDLLSFLPACSYLAKRLNEVAKEADIYWLINTDLTEGFVNGIISVSEHYGQKFYKFEKIDKKSGHPSIEGMRQIAEKIKELK